MTRIVVLAYTLAAFSQVRPVHAGVESNAAREAAEYVLRKFGKEAAKDAVPVMARKIEALAVQHGSIVYNAVRRAGPRAVSLLERAGTHGAQAANLLAKHGDTALAIISRPRHLALAAKHGGEAVTALLRHKGIAGPVIETLGQPAAKALGRVSSRNGRRMAMMVADGTIAKTGRSKELLDVVGKYGDRAMTFIWEHKGALAITAVLAAFLPNPEAFITGVKDITKVAGEYVARPIAEVPGKVASEAARHTNWTLIGVLVVLLVAGYFGWRLWVLRSSSRRERAA